MKCRQLGSSVLNVSAISLGSWLTYGVGASRPEQLEEIPGASGLAVHPRLFERAEAIVAGLGA